MNNHSATLKERLAYLSGDIMDALKTYLARDEVFGAESSQELVTRLLERGSVGCLIEEIMGVLEQQKNQIIDRYQGCPLPYDAAEPITQINEVMRCLEPLRHIALSLSDIPEPDQLPEPDTRKYTAA
jgi:hypothetical protein